MVIFSLILEGILTYLTRLSSKIQFQERREQYLHRTFKLNLALKFVRTFRTYFSKRSTAVFMSRIEHIWKDFFLYCVNSSVATAASVFWFGFISFIGWFLGKLQKLNDNGEGNAPHSYFVATACAWLEWMCITNSVDFLFPNPIEPTWRAVEKTC